MADSATAWAAMAEAIAEADATILSETAAATEAVVAARTVAMESEAEAVVQETPATPTSAPIRTTTRSPSPTGSPPAMAVVPTASASLHSGTKDAATRMTNVMERAENGEINVTPNSNRA